MQLPIERAEALVQKMAAKFLVVNRDGSTSKSGTIDGATSPKDYKDWLATYKNKAAQSKVLAAIPVAPTSTKGTEFFDRFRRGLSTTHGKGKDADVTKAGAAIGGVKMPSIPGIKAPKAFKMPKVTGPVGNVHTPPLPRRNPTPTRSL